MKLKVFLPTRILIDQETTKIVAEAENGSFCLLPRHIDFVAALSRGIVSFESETGEEFLAVDEGILVKRASEVRISTRRAVYSRDLHQMKEIIKQEFSVLDDREKKIRSVLAKLEADFARSLFEKP